MKNVKYFTDLFESITDYKKIVLFMFLIKTDVNFLYECGFLKGDFNYLHKEFRNILLEMNEEYSNDFENEEESIIEKILKKYMGNDINHLSSLFIILNI